MAAFFQNRADILKVFHTSCEEHPGHKLAARTFSGHGAVVTFEPDLTRQQTSVFIDSLKLPLMSTNFGAHISTIEQLAVFTYFKLDPKERQRLEITDSLVRLSVGIDYPLEALFDDISTALELARKA